MIALIFGIFVLGIYGFIWLKLYWLYLYCREQKARWVQIAGCIPLGGWMLIAIALIVMQIAGFILWRQPGYVFKQSLGKKPSANITDIKSEAGCFYDNCHTFLSFKTDYDQYLKLVPAEMTRYDYKEFSDKMPYNSLKEPRWWLPVTPETTDIRLLLSGKNFAEERTVMSYEAESSRGQFFFFGYD